MKKTEAWNDPILKNCFNVWKDEKLTKKRPIEGDTI